MNITNTLRLIQLVVMLVLEIAARYSLMLTLDNVLNTYAELFCSLPCQLSSKKTCELYVLIGLAHDLLKNS